MSQQRTLARRSVPNVDSTARDHLANERTYLAWIRTGLAAGAFGVALIEFVERAAPVSWVAGSSFLAVGLVVILYGTARFYRTQRDLQEGRVAISGAGPMLVALLAAAVTIVASVAALT